MSIPTIISLGAGVQSSAMVIMACKGLLKADYAIMSDTGSEKPQTYDYLKRFLIPYAEEHEFKIVIVRWDGEFNTRKKRLHQWYYDDKSLPFRVNRGCTDNWKIRPIQRYLTKHEPNGAVQLLGISFDEIHRMKYITYKNYVTEYPLIDKRITREDLYNLYRKWKLPIPDKSGCWMCPFQRKADWIRLRRYNNELFEFACSMEDVAEVDLPKQDPPQKFYPLWGKTKLRVKFKNNSNLLKFFGMEDEDPWCGTNCFT